ncbi:phage tail protein [Embleya hyalina]|uniref:Phage tail protein n=1 Tax=Embleya hyalina TaxID=516124 RepID=A0A401Z4L6_9ACTN|nr:phage tail protein [Embleya hyalina]GCE01787.1 phage tail protein [Embleya hyalina]
MCPDPNTTTLAASSYGHLPAIHAADPVTSAFAAAIDALTDPLEERLDAMADVFDPWRCPAPGLAWLAHISGARTEPDWTEEQVRTAIDLAPRLLARRGTVAALLLEAEAVYGWSPAALTVDDQDAGGGTIRVTLRIDADERQAQRRLARLVDAHCPAHLSPTVAVTTTGAQAAGRTVGGRGGG